MNNTWKDLLIELRQDWSYVGPEPSPTQNDHVYGSLS